MLGDLIALVGLVKDYLEWEELTPLIVELSWAELAQANAIIPSGRTYAWVRSDRVPTMELSGTHEKVWLVDKKKRTKQLVSTRDGLWLVAKRETV